MSVRMYGNINGSYKRPDINLFEIAKKQGNQFLKFRDADAGKNLPVIKLNISEEGLRALHGSKLKGGIDVQKAEEELRYISEHQPVESFTNRFSRVLNNGYTQVQGTNLSKGMSAQEKADILSKEFINICDEIVSGYDAGERVRFIADSTTEDGYRKISKEDELAILLNEFGEFVEKRLGKEHKDECTKLIKQAKQYVVNC